MKSSLNLTLVFLSLIWGCRKKQLDVEYIVLTQDISAFIIKSDSALLAANSVSQYQSITAEIEREINSRYLPRVDSLMLRETDLRKKTNLQMIREFLILYSKMDRSSREEAELRELRKMFDEILKRR